jgi:hypothetical protein
MKSPAIVHGSFTIERTYPVPPARPLDRRARLRVPAGSTCALKVT